MVDIRSSSLTSSYTSGTLSIATPATMENGDFLVVFLIALGTHWGGYYDNLQGTGELAPHDLVLGDPPPGASIPSGGFATSGPVLPDDYPHWPPTAVLATRNRYAWESADLSTSGYVGNYWSNLGMPHNDGTYDTSGLATWPFQYTWAGPATIPRSAATEGVEPAYSNLVYGLTAVGRVVDGSEPSTLTFTLNNPLDSEYDYRALALCFEPTDWSGNYWDNPDPDVASGTGDRYLDGHSWALWPATGARSQMPGGGANTGPHPNGLISTYYMLAPSGPYTFGTFRDQEAYLPRSHFPWPPFSGSYADPSNPQAALPQPPLETDDDLILHLLAYGAPSSLGDPSDITVADLSATPSIDPLPVIHEEAWAKGSNSLLVRLSRTNATTDHATDADGTGIVVLTTRVFSPEGPITAPTLTPDPDILSGSPMTGKSAEDQEQAFGLALTFRVRAPYVPAPVVSIPTNMATIVG